MLTERRAGALAAVVFLATVLPLSESCAHGLATTGSAATIAMAWREALGRWTWDPWTISALLLSAVWYARGLLRLVGHGDMRRVVPPIAPIYFAAGFAVMTIALLSPLDGLSDALFSAHMVQHLLLLLVAAPLFVRSWLLFVLFWAFPLRIRRYLARFWLATPSWRRLVRFVEHPVTIWTLSAAILCLWHLPGPYDHLFDETLVDDDGTPAARFQRPLRSASINSRLWFVRIAAGALVISGVDQTQLNSLKDLICPLDRCQTILRFFIKRQADEGQSGSMTERIGKALVLLARDYCRLPEADVARIATWAKRLKLPAPNGLTDKNTQRLRALMEPRARAMLLCFPQELMRRAALPNQKPEEAARLAMYAVAMEILLICPMRRKNLVGLRLDQHLYRPDPREKRLTHIIINAGAVKNSNAIQWPMPAESARLIETFITRHRQHLVNPGNPFLFGTGDKLRSAQHLGEWLAADVTRAIGVGFNVHLARHFAAWNFLRSNPGQYEVVRQVLGHRNIAVTMAYYVGLEADSAAEHFDATVLRDRQAVRKLAAHGFRQGAWSKPTKASGITK